METTLNNKNQKAFTFNLEVGARLREICSLFINTYGITGVCYYRYYKDGKILRLGTIDEWTKKYFEYQFYNSESNEYPELMQLLRRDEHKIIQVGQPIDTKTEVLYELGIWNSCGTFKKLSDSIEGFFLAGDKNNSKIIDLFLNKRELFNHILLFIKYQLKDILNDKQCLIETAVSLSGFFDSQNISGSLLNEDHLENELFEDTKIEKYFLNTQNGDAELSRREYQILQSISEGKTSKEVARILNLSPRTVESFIQNTKQKLNCYSKSELIILFQSYGIRDIFEKIIR